MRLITLFVILIFPCIIFAYSEETIIVDKCRMNVIVAQTPEEHMQGLLGQTEQSFFYDGMLFSMNDPKMKTFHTIGMSMPIYIVALIRMPDGRYKSDGPVYYAPEGINRISLSGSDVLEMTESKYKYKFKACINSIEANVGD